MAEVNSRDSVDWPRGPKDILAGLILPLPFLVYGIACVATRTGWIPDGVPGLSGVTFHVRLDGGSAVALGIAVINIHPPSVLFGVFVLYGLSGYGVYAWRKAKGQHSSVISTSTDEPDERGLHK